MKHIKKALAALLIFIMLFGVFPPELIPLSPEIPGITPIAGAFNTYNDVSGHWAAAAINRWNNLGFIDGGVFTDSAFEPDKYITRVEFFSLLSRALGATALSPAFTPRTSAPFSDLDELPQNLYDIVSVAFQMGIANGLTDGTMRPHGNLLRQDAATLAARALGMHSSASWNLDRFTDSAFIAAYAQTHVTAFVERGLMAGYPDGSFRPSAYLTRAEAVQILNNLFANVHLPEAGLRDVYLQGSLVVQNPGAEVREVVIDGDIIIGDGVGNGDVVLADCIINGRLIVRGGGPNSVTLSNTNVSGGIYVASFAADTRIVVTDNSTVPILQSVSGFTLSGSGVASVYILENARERAVVTLDGVSLDDLNINAPGAQVRLNSGHAINVRFDAAGQNATLNLAAGTSVGHLVISAPNAAVTGTGSIRNMIINNSGAVVAQNPELLTLGVNISATVAGQNISTSETQWPNSRIDRVSGNSTLRVQLLPNTGGGAPFDQSSLTLNMVAGAAAAEGHVSQAAANRVPLTQRNDRWAYWIGFFVPAPQDAASLATVTYTYIDGEPITLPPAPLNTWNGRQGLLIYLPVFREPGREVGMIKELLHINWGAQLTENLHFMSSTIHINPPNASQRNMLQDDFDNRVMYSIQAGSSPYTGAEAIRRILNSDNPLGLPSSGNRALDAVNRALMADEVRSIIEDSQFAAELTIDTSGNSQYSRLSDAGKLFVAREILNGRRTQFTTPSAVKAIFDRAVQARLAAETALLTQINSSVDYAALRTIIELAANAAILEFQTGAEPYRNFTNRQRDEMAQYLWELRPFRSIQEVIDAIRKYLSEYPSGPGDPGDFDLRDLNIRRIAVIPTSVTYAPGNTATVTVSIELADRVLTPEQNRSLVNQLFSRGILTYQWNSAAPGVPEGTNGRVMGNDMNVFSVLCIHDGLSTVGRQDRLTFAVVDAAGRRHTATVNFTAAPLVRLTALSLPSRLDIVVGESEQLIPTRTPPTANELLVWNSIPNAVASVEANGPGAIVTGQSPGRALVTARGNVSGVEATTEVWVFRSREEVLVHPSPIFVRVGSEVPLEAVFFNNQVRPLVWISSNTSIATVSQSGTRGFVRGVSPGTTVITVNIPGSDIITEVIVNVLSDADFGVTTTLTHSIVNSGGTTTMRMNAVNPTAAEFLRLYPVVVPVTVATVPPGPYNIDDPVIITARPNGAGPATVLLYDSDPSAGVTGDPVSIQEIRVSPESVGGITFNYQGPSQSGTIRSTGHEDVIQMTLDETVVVTPMLNNAPHTGAMVWHTYMANYYREILRNVSVSNDGSNSILGKYDGLPLQMGTPGVPVSFGSAFNTDSGTIPADAATFTGFHDFVSSNNVAASARRVELLRRADTTKVEASHELVATDGRIRNTSEMTGLYAIFYTPERNLDSQDVPVWGNLFFRENMFLFGTDGEYNQIISPSSGFRVERRDRDPVTNVFGPWVSAPTGPGLSIDYAKYDRTGGFIFFDAAPGLTGPSGTAEYRIVDVNGVQVSNTAPIRAIVDEDQYADFNYFYVHLQPRPVRFVSPQTTITAPTITWNETIHIGRVHREAIIPGSHRGIDFYDFEGKEDPVTGLPGPAPLATAENAMFPEFFEANITGIVRNPTIEWFLAQYYLSLDLSNVLRDPPPPRPPGQEGTPHNYIFVVGVSQHGNTGFASRGTNTGRMRFAFSITNDPPLTIIIPVLHQQPFVHSVALWEWTTGVGTPSSGAGSPTRPSGSLLAMDPGVGPFLTSAGIDINDPNFMSFSDNPSVLTTSGNSYTIVGPGTARITARLGATGNPAYIDVTVRQVYDIAAGSTTLEPLVERQSVIQTGVPRNAQTLFSSSDENVFRIVEQTPPPATHSGLTARALGVAPGVADLTITNGGASASIRILVYQPAAPPSPIQPLGFPIGPIFSTASMPAVASAALSVGIDLEDAVFVSEDPEILSIDEEGNATPRRAGRTRVNIRSRSSGRSVSVNVEIASDGTPVGGATVVVTEPGTPSSAQEPSQPGQQPGTPPTTSAPAPTEIRLRSTAGVAIGGTTRLEPFVVPFNADRGALIWSSSDTGVAEVSGGIVTGVRAGTATITAANANGSIKAECKVTVRADSRPVTSISLNRSTLSLNTGRTGTLTVSYRPSNATMRNVTWVSDNSAVARVEPNGRVTAVSAGTATITAISDSGAHTAQCVVTVNVPVASVSLPESRVTLRVGDTYQIYPIINPPDATVTTTTYSSGSTRIASVSSDGLITANRAGTATITVRVGSRSTSLRVTVER